MLNLKLIQQEINSAIRANIQENDRDDGGNKVQTPSSISVFGLGTTGIVSSASLAQMGHNVIGVDTNIDTVRALNSGIPPLADPELAERVCDDIKSSKFLATTNAEFALLNTDVSLVCDDAQNPPGGSLGLTYLIKVSEEIGKNIRNKQTPHTIVFRSIVEVEVVRNILTPILQNASGKKESVGFSVCFHPDFLPGGKSIEDLLPNDISSGLICSVSENKAPEQSALCYGQSW